MTPFRPTVVFVTTHTVLRDVYERHGERFAKIVCVPDVAELERRSVQLGPSAVILDVDSLAEIVEDVKRIKKNATLRKVRIVVIVKNLTHDHRVLLQQAGVDDILFTTYFTPRDIMARLQKLL